jgi:hypothetical protein
MSWGTLGNVTTNNLDSSADDPSQARAELYNALVELQAVISGRGTADGVASLDGTGKIPNTQLPNTITSGVGTNLILSPDQGRVSVNDILLLNPKTVTELNALTSVEGDIAYCSNGDAGSKCIAVYDGSNWKVISLGSTISAT